MRFITQHATRRLRFLISLVALMLQLLTIPALAQNTNARMPVAAMAIAMVPAIAPD